MDLGKYVAMGVLAVIVLAAVTYEAPKQPGAQPVSDGSRVSGTFSGQGGGGPPPIEAEPVTAPVDSALAPIVPVTPIEQAAAKLPELIRFSVKAGQTLHQVAQEVLGDGRRWREIYEANKNKIPDPNNVRAGTELEFPQERVAKSPKNAPTTLPASAPAEGSCSAPASLPSGRTHTVTRGETLYAIARKELGSGNRWKELMKLNDLRSEQVAAGTVLKLPPR